MGEIALPSRLGDEAEPALSTTGSHATLMGQISALVAEMTAEEEHLLAERQATAAEANGRVEAIYERGAIAGGTLFLSFGGMLAAAVGSRTRAARQRAVRAERHRGEEALWESERRQRTLIEALPQLIWTCHAHGTCEYLSPQWIAYTGQPETAHFGYGWLDVVHPDDRAPLRRVWDQALQSSSPYEANARIRSANGQYRWFKHRAVPLVASNGAVERWLGTSTDISDLIEIADALKRNEERLNLALNIGELGSWDWDLRADEVIWGGNQFTILGYEPAPDRPVPASMWRDRLHPDDLPQVLRVLNAARNSRTPYRAYYRITRADDGRLAWIESTGQFFYDEAGPIRMVGALRDVTERRLAEEKLRESEVRYRILFEQAAVGIAQVSLHDGTYLEVNAKLCEMLGYSAEEFARLSYRDVTYAPDLAEEEALLARLLARKIQTYELEKRYVRKDGSHLWVRLQTSIVSDHSLVAAYRVAIVVDISERKCAEDALFREKERAEVTLHCIGDAVITTDEHGVVQYLNPVAEALTGWSLQEAEGRSLQSVFNIINEQHRDVVPDPVSRCIAEGRIIGLANHTILISRTGQEHAIADSAAPIRDREGTLLGAVLVFHDVTETRRLARQLQHDASHDALTGLVNRREFERRLERAVLNTQRYGSEHALCYFDLDQFKLVNDTAGHACGDALLKEVRGLLAGKFRDRDTLARLGGDEFALLLENCGLNEACRIAEVIVAAFREWRFTWAGRTYQVGVSAGLVAVTAQSENSAQLLAQADVACYTAKEQGRNRVHVYRRDGVRPSPQHAQILLAATLTDALTEERFRLFAQPIVPLARNESSTRYEILLRLIDPLGNIVSPESFIPAAERYGLMAAIDRWVITNAFRVYAAGKAKRRGIEISINLSGDSLNTGDFSEFVIHQFQSQDVPPERVCFEITETAAIQNLEQALQFIGEIKAFGSRFALDDFGSGLSSFRYLRELPADYLKIDGCFVRNMSWNAQDEAVVSAINEVGHTLGIITVAEYAHDTATVDSLRRAGVDYAQGAAFGAPVPMDETFIALAGD